MSSHLGRGLVAGAAFIILIVACQSESAQLHKSATVASPRAVTLEANSPATPTAHPTATRMVSASPMPTVEPALTLTYAALGKTGPMETAVAAIDCCLDWNIISRPTARPSSHFDFDGQSLVYWAYQSPGDRKALALTVESGGEVRQVYRVPREPPWQVEEVQVDGAHAAWLEIGWGDDPRVYRLLAFDLASGVTHVVTETQPSPQPHVPALALDGNRLVVRALGADGKTCLYVYDLSSGMGREPLCSPYADVLYGDPYLRGSILAYVVEDRRQNCSFVQQTDLNTGRTTTLRAVTCQAGLRAAADDSLLIWPEKVLSQETGDIAVVRLRGMDRQGNTYDLGGESTSYYHVCDGRAYWLSVIAGESAETREIRTWAPGEPIAVLYRAAAGERILGPVCQGGWIAFINPASGAVLGAQTAHAPGACRRASESP